MERTYGYQQVLLNKVVGLMRIAGQEYDSWIQFYNSAAWKKRRAEILKLDKNECQMCKAQGKYTKAQVVHHVQHLKDRPDLALSIWHRGQRQLVSLCNECHNKVHPEKGIRGKAKAVLTNEWW